MPQGNSLSLHQWPSIASQLGVRGIFLWCARKACQAGDHYIAGLSSQAWFLNFNSFCSWNHRKLRKWVLGEVTAPGDKHWNWRHLSRTLVTKRSQLPLQLTGEPAVLMDDGWMVVIICLICGCSCRIKAMTTPTKGSELLMTQGSYRDCRDWGIGPEVK